MSLAPPQPHHNSNPRLSSVLPGITCSTCAAQIPLGHLGDHVCADARRQPARQPAPAALPVGGTSSLSARTPMPLKIDLGVVSNWTDQVRKGAGEAGMAGVGRRGFGMDYDGTPSPTFLHPLRAHTPPHAYISSGPSTHQAQNASSPYFIAAQAAAAAVPPSAHLDTSIPDRAPSPLATSRDPTQTRFHPPGSYNASTHEPMVSPPGVPQTATSNATISYTTATEMSPRDPSTMTMLMSSVKGKGPAYPRPSVTPAEYTHQQQQQRQRMPGGTSGRPVVELQERPGSTSKGPLKVVNTTPRPESIDAFQKETGALSKVAGSRLASGPTTTDISTSGTLSPLRDSLPEHSKWNTLRRSLRRGPSFNGTSAASSSPALAIPEITRPEDSGRAGQKSAERDSLEQLQDLLTSGSTDKMQFLERYKQMAEAGGARSLPMSRSLSNQSPTDGGAGTFGRLQAQDITGRAEALGSSVDEATTTKSLSMVRLEEAYVDDDRAHGFHNLRSDADRPTTVRPLGPRRPSGSRLTHGKRVQDNGSISSIDSAQADKIRMGEADLLTPSTSMDRLAEIAPGGKQTGASRGEASWEDQDAVEGLLDKPKETASDFEFDHMFSPNLSQATSGQSSRFRRESAASSLLAPSDSISTPGINDKFHIDYTVTAAVQARLKPGSKACQKCGQSLKGKRFIERDGMLLCEPDWKEMFLPKCRRCEKAIETSAVSSRDGQLKGKWHRACFSCYRCSAAFEGDSFYVHDDKPYCQLHYHEANGSLCASQQCGKPIEGPCLLTADNLRFHPGHLKCDYGSGHRPCGDPMIDYYEIGTLKVCERHKDSALSDTIKRGQRTRSGEMTAKAEKRRTRIIDSK